MSDDVTPQQERAEVEGYLSTHQLEDSLNNIINKIVREKPLDPFVVMADLLKAKSPAQSGILNVFAREILNSKGIPTVEVDVTTHKGVFSASYPCKMAGNGPTDPVDMRDADDTRFQGYGVTKVVSFINDEIAPALKNLNPTDQVAIDEVLLKKTKPTKSDDNDDDEGDEPGLPFMATLPVSMAICRAGARQADLPLWEYIAGSCAKVHIIATNLF
jgi:enolase